ncbi:MAG: oxygen-independent coproporphyrinogen III oxidase [Betaproteobacteria bacterium]|nr:oxygen-independent coproporphyrinogen III oxidase [Betaproteobacteria bacterium]
MPVSHLCPAPPATGVLIDPEMVRKYDKPGPRYTSYPTPDCFIEAYDTQARQASLRQRMPTWGPRTNAEPFSLYVHIPFCRTACHFCACNMVVGDDAGSASYLKYLEREFSMVADALEGSRRADQISIGGGTPTFLSTAGLEMLMHRLGQHFELLPGEYAVEIDPRTVDDEKIAALGQLGFNRMSLGIQDFDPDVQQAVNRVQTVDETARAITAARRYGFMSINLDLIYGLPKQSLGGFDDTLDQVLAMMPGRVTLYGYDHLPGMHKSQRQIDTNDLPGAEARLELLVMATNKLTGAGYVYIGMDHFALPDDELVIAARHAGLRRNLLGYSTHPDTDVLAFGISAISKVGTTYSQNVKTLAEYYDRLDRDELPVLRGIELTADDLLRRAIIQALICHFELSIESIEIAYLIKFREYFSSEWDKLEELQREGLITLEPEWLNVTPRGRLLVRSVAMVFDRHLSRIEQRERFSKII